MILEVTTPRKTQSALLWQMCSIKEDGQRKQEYPQSAPPGSSSDMAEILQLLSSQTFVELIHENGSMVGRPAHKWPNHSPV